MDRLLNHCCYQNEVVKKPRKRLCTLWMLTYLGLLVDLVREVMGYVLQLSFA